VTTLSKKGKPILSLDLCEAIPAFKRFAARYPDNLTHAWLP